jgi:hypothetical protein
MLVETVERSVISFGESDDDVVDDIKIVGVARIPEGGGKTRSGADDEGGGWVRHDIVLVG